MQGEHILHDSKNFFIYSAFFNILKNFINKFNSISTYFAFISMLNQYLLF
jgi:hypothetical protein